MNANPVLRAPSTLPLESRVQTYVPYVLREPSESRTLLCLSSLTETSIIRCWHDKNCPAGQKKYCPAGQFITRRYNPKKGPFDLSEIPSKADRRRPQHIGLQVVPVQAYSHETKHNVWILSPRFWDRSRIQSTKGTQCSDGTHRDGTLYVFRMEMFHLCVLRLTINRYDESEAVLSSKCTRYPPSKIGSPDGCICPPS